MNFDTFIKRFEVSLTENAEAESTSDHFINEDFIHVFRRIIPFLIIPLLTALAIDIVFIFSVPEEWTRVSWFWLKEPCALLLGYLIGTPVAEKLSR